MELPFGPNSLTGIELELVAPPGKTRLHLAEALAKAFEGRLQYGLKYYSDGIYADDRPMCQMTLAYRVTDDAGETIVTVVDDMTLNDGFDRDAPTPDGLYRVVLDDVRLALWAEARCWADNPQPEAILRPFIDTFDATIRAVGVPPAQHSDHRAVTDPYGHTLGVIALYPAERIRAAEIVTRPLRRDERLPMIQTICDAASELGFVIPREAAMHFHVDAAPWQSTARLRRLILDSEAVRDMLWKELGTNEHCVRLGGNPKEILQLAEKAEPSLDFETFRDQMSMAGATKLQDINYLGVIWRDPKQPTLELRCLPMSLDAKRVAALLDQTEGFLKGVAEAGDREV